VPETGVRGAHAERLAVTHGVGGWPATAPSATGVTSLFPFGLHARWILTCPARRSRTRPQRG
jgi:hypothetical protein